jgi:HEAT repeat protein
LIAESNNHVKEVIAAAIGGIGLPEALPCLNKLLQTIENKD